MVEIHAIFLDDGGVMNDNSLRSPQWQQLVAQYFSPRFGGAPESWKKANYIVIEEQIQRYQEMIKGDQKVDFQKNWHNEQIRWVTEMFEHVGIEPPPYKEREALARDSHEWITPKVQAAFPGVVDTIHKLKQQGHLLYTASGDVSRQLKGTLTGMGVVDCFERLYGSDLVNTYKGGSLFYERVLKDAGIEPQSALIVDDSPEILTWAVEIQAIGVLVGGFQKTLNSNIQYQIPQFRDLPKLLQQIT